MNKRYFAYFRVKKSHTHFIRKGASIDEQIRGVGECLYRVEFDSQEKQNEALQKYKHVSYICEECREKESDVCHSDELINLAISCPICGQYFMELESDPLQEYYQNWISY